MKKVRYGIVGFGHQGEYYANILKDHGLSFDSEVVSICDIDEGKRKKAK